MMIKSNGSYSIDTHYAEVVRNTAVDVSQFKSEMCAHFFAWFSSFHPNQPRRDQFDILDHIEKAPNIYLVRVLDQGEYEYRIQGEIVTQLVGKFHTAKTFSCGSQEGNLGHLAKHLDEIVSGKGAVHSYGNLKVYDKPYTQFESITFPLVDAQKKITHIIGVMSPMSKT